MNQAIRNIVMPLLSLPARKYLDCTHQLLSSFEDRQNNFKTLKRYLELMDLSVDPSTLSRIKDPAFIEIYNRQYIQIFRSYNVYEISSFTAEEMSEKRFDQLFHRPEFYNRLLMKMAETIFKKQKREMSDFCPEHLVIEKKENPQAAKIGYNFAAPVYDQTGSVIGILLSQKIELIKDQKVGLFDQPVRPISV